jgi:glycosyltransferase involved in cell wall biosynthesis
MSVNLSVLMPVYNAERYLAQAVESICRQTCRDFEFVIVNDGSTDGSAGILGDYAARDDRIRLIGRPNAGLVASLNDGLAAARGEFVARMDADDVALPRRFERQLDYLRRHPECVAVGTRVLVVDPEGWPIHVWDSPPAHEEIDGRHMAADNEVGATAIIHPTAMLRRQAVEAVGRYRPAYGQAEDFDLWLRLAEVGRLANLPDVLLQYRRHPQGLSASRSHLPAYLRQIWGARLEAHRRRNLAFDRPAPTDSRWTASDSRLHWVEMAWRAGNYATARKHGWPLFWQAPSWARFRLLVKAGLGPAARPAVSFGRWLRARAPHQAS